MHAMFSKNHYLLQSGSRGSHSSESALAEKTSDLHATKSNGQVTISSHLVSRWYLTVHSFLPLLIILPFFGSCDVSFSWLSSYLGSSSLLPHPPCPLPRFSFLDLSLLPKLHGSVPISLSFCIKSLISPMIKAFSAMFLC